MWFLGQVKGSGFGFRLYLGLDELDRSVIVTVAIVRVVQVPVNNVAGVIAVGDSFVSTVWSMNVVSVVP